MRPRRALQEDVVAYAQRKQGLAGAAAGAARSDAGFSEAGSAALAFLGIERR